MFGRKTNLPIAILGASRGSSLETTIVDSSSLEFSRSSHRRSLSLVSTLADQLQAIGCDPTQAQEKGLKFHIVGRSLFDGLALLPHAKTVSNDVLFMQLKEPMEKHIFVEEGGVRRTTRLAADLKRAIEDGGI